MDLRRQILDASVLLISEKGVGALSMREVARRIGVTHGAPYHHFKDRAEILAAICEEGYLALAEAMRSAVAEETAGPRAQFEAAGRAYVSFAIQSSALFRIMFRPELAEKRKHRAIEKASAEAFAVLVGVVAALHADGIAADLDPMALTLTGWSTAHGLAALCVDGPLAKGLDGFAPDAASLASKVGETLGKLLEAPRRLQPRKR